MCDPPPVGPTCLARSCMTAGVEWPICRFALEMIGGHLPNGVFSPRDAARGALMVIRTWTGSSHTAVRAEGRLELETQSRSAWAATSASADIIIQEGVAKEASWIQPPDRTPAHRSCSAR